MQIRDVKCYLLKGEPATRQESCGSRGSIAPVPPGISGLLTHDQGFGAADPEGFTFTGEEPEPTYRLMIRLVTDGDLDAYADYATGYNPSGTGMGGQGVFGAVCPHAHRRGCL